VLHGRRDLQYTLGHTINWLFQIANGVKYLHTYNPKPIIHRDLKPLK
jgi:serine/threonine protein kinase